MGCLGINYLPQKTSQKAVKEFLELLGYEVMPRDIFRKKDLYLSAIILMTTNTFKVYTLK
jgi:hypothetical protein